MFVDSSNNMIVYVCHFELFGLNTKCLVYFRGAKGGALTLLTVTFGRRPSSDFAVTFDRRPSSNSVNFDIRPKAELKLYKL